MPPLPAQLFWRKEVVVPLDECAPPPQNRLAGSGRHLFRSYRPPSILSPAHFHYRISWQHVKEGSRHRNWAWQHGFRRKNYRKKNHTHTMSLSHSHLLPLKTSLSANQCRSVAWCRRPGGRVARGGGASLGSTYWQVSTYWAWTMILFSFFLYNLPLPPPLPHRRNQFQARNNALVYDDPASLSLFIPNLKSRLARRCLINTHK